MSTQGGSWGDDVDMVDTLQQERNQMFFCLLSAIVEVLIIVTMTDVSKLLVDSLSLKLSRRYPSRSVALPPPPLPLLSSHFLSPSLSVLPPIFPSPLRPSVLPSLCPSLSLLRVSLYLCVSPCVSLRLRVSLCVSLSVCLYPSLSMRVSLCVSLCLCVSASLCLSLSYVFVDLSTCLHVGRETGSYVSVVRALILPRTWNNCTCVIAKRLGCLRWLVHAAGRDHFWSAPTSRRTVSFVWRRSRQNTTIHKIVEFFLRETPSVGVTTRVLRPVKRVLYVITSIPINDFWWSNRLKRKTLTYSNWRVSDRLYRKRHIFS